MGSQFQVKFPAMLLGWWTGGDIDCVQVAGGGGEKGVVCPVAG